MLVDDATVTPIGAEDLPGPATVGAAAQIREQL